MRTLLEQVRGGEAGDDPEADGMSQQVFMTHDHMMQKPAAEYSRGLRTIRPIERSHEMNRSQSAANRAEVPRKLPRATKGDSPC